MFWDFNGILNLFILERLYLKVLKGCFLIFVFFLILEISYKMVSIKSII